MTQPSTPPLAADASNVSDARTPRRALAKPIAAVAFLLIVIAGWLLFQKRAPRAASPLEPTPATISVLVPAERDPVILPTPTQPNALPATPITVAEAASAAVETAVDTVGKSRTALDQLTARVDALDAHDRAHADQITALRSELDHLKNRGAAAPGIAASDAAQVSTVDGARIFVPPTTATEPQQQAPRTAPRPAAHRSGGAAARRAAGAVASSKASASLANTEGSGSVLAVDLWGGKPSVVLSRPGANGTELKFFNEGESQGRVTVKRADVGSQNATFATPSGEFTLAPKGQ